MKQSQRNALDGYWYTPPDLNRALKIKGCAGTFGCDHTTVPNRSHSNRQLRGSKKLDSASSLGISQRTVLENQSSSYHQFPHRVQAVIRGLRKRGVGRRLESVPHADPLPARWFTLGSFMDRLEQETGYRLVHLKLMVMTKEDPDKLAVHLGYALDRGARYFAAVCWTQLHRPKHPCEFQQASVSENTNPQTQITWWGNAGIEPPNQPEVFLYTCPCKTC